MICSKEREKNNRFGELCMQWIELVADVLATHFNQYIFSFFSLINILYMERINKATLFVNLLFFGTKKEEIYKNRLRLGVAVLFLQYTFVFR